MSFMYNGKLIVLNKNTLNNWIRPLPDEPLKEEYCHIILDKNYVYAALYSYPQEN